MGDGMTLVDDFMTLLPHLDVVHHVPGRIRLKLRFSGLQAFRKMDVNGIVSRIPGVVGFRVNVVARSVVVDYDDKVLPFELWQKMDRFKELPELESEVRSELGFLLRG
ncbi:MAG: hypothetical protein GX422_16685 [Deltaproteobacteria bacterium]|nr:hypothetical protein [Deltaproteobacteria bacterium]